jgi:hypothetical protein
MPGAGAYLDALDESWRQRAEREGSATADVCVAGWRLRLDGAPESITNAVSGAFDRNGDPTSRPPDLHVNLAAGAPPATPRGPGWGEHDRLHFHNGRVEIHTAPNAPLSALDHERARAVCWFPEPELPYWELGAPLRTVLAWFALRRSAFLAHGAAVAEDGRAVLLLGPGGAGKTTTALAAWSEGMDYLGDDYVLVRVAPQITVARAYATAKADGNTAALLPKVGWPGAPPRLPLDDPAGDDKTVLQLGGALGLDVAEAHVVAIVVPRVAPDARIEPMEPAATLRAAAPSTLFQLPTDRGVAFPMLADVVRRTPCFALATGPDPRRAAALVRSLLHDDRIHP